MTKKKLLQLITTASVITFAIFASYRCGLIGDSAKRVHREHGLWLPDSASKFECRGDAWLGILDRGASSAFEISTNDLRNFINQLQIQAEESIGIPGNPQYKLRAEWRQKNPMYSFHCDSPTGDWLYVEVWPINNDTVGICLYTDWN